MIALAITFFAFGAAVFAAPLRSLRARINSQSKALQQKALEYEELITQWQNMEQLCHDSQQVTQRALEKLALLRGENDQLRKWLSPFGETFGANPAGLEVRYLGKVAYTNPRNELLRWREVAARLSFAPPGTDVSTPEAFQSAQLFYGPQVKSK